MEKNAEKTPCLRASVVKIPSDPGRFNLIGGLALRSACLDRIHRSTKYLLCDRGALLREADAREGVQLDEVKPPRIDHVVDAGDLQPKEPHRPLRVLHDSKARLPCLERGAG